MEEVLDKIENQIKQMRDECIFIMQERPKKFWQVS